MPASTRQAASTCRARVTVLRPVLVAAKTLTVGLVAYHQIPFDFVTSTAGLRESLHQPRIRAALQAADAEAWIAWAWNAGQLALVGFLRVPGVCELGGSLRRSIRSAMSLVWVLALVVEVLQVFVMCLAFDAMDGLAGVLCLSAASCMVWTRRESGRCGACWWWC